MNNKTLIRGESLSINVKLDYDGIPFSEIDHGEIIANAWFQNNVKVPLIVTQLEGDGEYNLYSDIDTRKLKGESFLVNIVVNRIEGDAPEDLIMATFNQTFYIVNSATDMDNRPLLTGGHSVVYLIDGEYYACQNYNEGAGIVPISVPPKDGYSFDGWSGLPDTMPNHCVVAFGSYTESEIIPTDIYLSDARCAIKLPNGEYIATDFGNHCIRIFSSASHGTPKITYGSYGANIGQFQHPVGICRDPDGYLWVANYNEQGRRAYLVKLSYDGNSVEEIERILLHSLHSVLYDSTSNKIIAVGYTVDEFYYVDPDDYSYETVSSNGAPLKNCAVLTSDGSKFYVITDRHHLYEMSRNTSTNGMNKRYLKDLHSLGNFYYQGICLTDDEQYLIIIGNNNGNVFKIKISDMTTEKIIGNNDLAKGYLLTNIGGNTIVFVGDAGTRVCEIHV